MNIASILSTVVSSIPLISQLIGAAEQLFGSGNGQAKSQFVVTATVAGLQVYAQATGLTLPSTFQSDIAECVNANVKVMNELGLLLPHTATATGKN